jgi:hypothetical protein
MPSEFYSFSLTGFRALNHSAFNSGNRPASALEQLPAASSIQYLSFRVSSNIAFTTVDNELKHIRWTL